MASAALILSLLLCGAFALRQQPEALYADPVRASEVPEACVEPARFLTDDLPKATMNLEQREAIMNLERREGLQMEADAELQQYVHNLSFVRKCNTIKDLVEFLGVLVVPRLKLAFCYVPKVACSQFKDLINSLNELPRDYEGFGHDYLASVRWRMHVRREEMSKQNGWTFATFLRDPALRYLSAFGSTCVAKDAMGHFEHRFECCGPLVQRNGIPKQEFVKHFRERLHADGREGVVMGDDHWVSQTQILKQCGWQWFKPENIDYRGYLAGDVNAQVKAMLKRVNYTNDTLVDRFFPPDRSIAGHRSPIQYPAEDFYNNKTALATLKKLYEDDYYNFPDVGCAFTDKMEGKLGAEAQAQDAKPQPPAEAPRPKRHPASVRRKPHPPTGKPLFPVLPKSLFPVAQPNAPNPFFRFAQPKAQAKA